MTCRTARSSAQSGGMPGSIVSWMAMPLALARSFRRWWHSSADMGELDRLLLELVAARLDAREVEDLVDEVEEVLARGVDVGDILLVVGHVERPEHLRLHHLGEAEDGVERRAQLVAHGRQEARLGEVGLLGAPPRLVGIELGLLELGDEGILLGPELERLDRRARCSLLPRTRK